MQVAMNYANAKNIGCKDIKIALFEIYDSERVWQFADKPDENCIGEYEPLKRPSSKLDESKKLHASHSAEVVRTLCPDAKIYVMRATEKSHQWCADNGIDIISMSLEGSRTDSEFELQFEEKIFNLTSAGNNKHLFKEGENSLTDGAKEKHWTSIGARQLIKFSETYIPLKETWYSSEGFELDFIGLTRLKLSDGKYYEGTSASTPFVAGLLAQWYQARYDHFGYKPTPDMAYDFMRRNAIDLEKAGHDDETGYGLFVLPKDEFRFSMYNYWDIYIQLYKPEGLTERLRKNIIAKYGEDFWKEAHGKKEWDEKLVELYEDDH